MSIELKIKAKSLAAEARIIRIEEKKLRLRLASGYVREHHKIEWKFSHIRDHRRGMVRKEARYTNIARAFLSGLTYKQVENIIRPENRLTLWEWDRVQTMVEKYGRAIYTDKRDLLQKFEEWRMAE